MTSQDTPPVALITGAAKRIGRDEDMAGTAVFLASKAGDYVVGDTLAVDGGVAYCSITEAWA